MKVLQVNCVFGVGSTGKITAQLHAGLTEQGIESVVCYGRGETIVQKNIYKTCAEFYSKVNHFYAMLRGQLYGGCIFSTAKLLSVIKRQKPDIVHLHCINGHFVNIPWLLNWLKSHHIKTVLTLHAEFMFTANCGHAKECVRWKNGCGKCPQLKTDIKSFGIDGTHQSWKKMERAFDGFRENLIIVSVSPWLMSRAIQSPFLSDKKHCVVMNGLDTEVFQFQNTDVLRQKYKADAKIILFVTTFLTDKEEDIKGGRYVLELARQLESENINILVAGQYDTSLTLPLNMVMLGRLENQDVLAQYYSMADVTILTSKRETFSMVTAESLCCGTPVVGFEAGGPEGIAIREYSEFVEQGNVEKLRDAINRMLDRKLDKKAISESAIRIYKSDRMVREYIELYCGIIGESDYNTS